MTPDTSCGRSVARQRPLELPPDPHDQLARLDHPRRVAEAEHPSRQLREIADGHPEAHPAAGGGRELLRWVHSPRPHELGNPLVEVDHHLLWLTPVPYP